MNSNTFNGPSSDVYVYSYTELDRYLRNPKTITSDLYDSVMEFIDPEGSHDKIVEKGEGSYWTLIDSNVQGCNVVQINPFILRKSKSKSKDLFEADPLRWIYCFKFLWWCKYKTECEICFSDVSQELKHENPSYKNYIGKYVCLFGRVKKLVHESVCVSTAVFSCKNCGSVQYTDIVWYEKPKKPRCGCGLKNTVIENENLRQHQTWQSIYVQRETVDESRQSQFVTDSTTIHCRILGVRNRNKVVPGDLVTIRGVVRSETTDTAKVHLYIDVFGVQPAVQKQRPVLTKKKLSLFTQLSKRVDILDHVKKAIFSQIEGLEQVKNALILQFLGGGVNTRRPNIHVLVVGDPGIGKSELLKAAQQKLQGVYATGLGSTVPGLTATVYKDTDNQWAVDGGAIVVANGSTLLLDEVDKLSVTVSNALLEPMEQMNVTICKAGINVSLPSKTNVFAVGNPKLSQTFETKSNVSLRTQIGMTAPLLSRFDLVFTITKEDASSVSDHILKNIFHRKKKEVRCTELVEYLRYASKNIKPIISNQIKAEMMDYFKTLNARFKNVDQFEVTPRLIEGALRLVEARAKLSLRTNVERYDFEFVKDLYQKSLKSQFRNLHFQSKNVINVAELNVSGKSLALMEQIRACLLTEDLTLEGLFTHLAQKDDSLTYKKFITTVKQMQDAAVIYKPNGYKYTLVRN